MLVVATTALFPVDEELAALPERVAVPEDVALAVPLAVVEADAALDVDEAALVVLAPLEALFEPEADVEAPASGAVDWPSICAWTEELNEPERPLILRQC